MEVLWERGASTVAEVQGALDAKLAYTTVLTILRTLESKGYAGHAEEGRAFRYRALVARDAARRTALRDLAGRLFKGSTELLLTHMVEDEELTDEQVRRIRTLLSRRARKAKP
jgi:predicted transcriptional regulator